MRKRLFRRRPIRIRTEFERREYGARWFNENGLEYEKEYSTRATSGMLVDVDYLL